MASSLAAQLQKAASLNTAYLNETTRRKPTQSYLFTGREADEHDLFSLHALGVNGLLQLSTINPIFRFYLTNLFADSARELDRTLLPAEQNAELNKHLTSLMRLLGPYLLDGPAGKVIEWLVRRFRIHEFNVSDILALFLPYHDTPHFQKMVTILHIKENTTWSFLLPYGSAAQPLLRQALVTEMLKNTDVARFVVNLVPQSISPITNIPNKIALRCHRTLIAFNTAVVHEYLERSKKLDESVLAFLLSAIIEPLNQHGLNTTPSDALLGSYILLCALSQRCSLTPKAIRSVLTMMAAAAGSETQKIETKQFLNTAVGFCAPQEEVEQGWPEGCLRNILSLNGVELQIPQLLRFQGSEKFIAPLLTSTADSLNEERMVQLWSSLLAETLMSKALVHKMAQLLAQRILLKEIDAGVDLNVRRLLQIIYQRHPEILQEVIDTMVAQAEGSDVDIKTRAEQLSISLSRVLSSSSGRSEGVQDALFAITSADALVRAKATKELVQRLRNLGPSDADGESICSALISHVQDSDITVLDALYNTDTPTVLSAFQANTLDYIGHLSIALCDKPKRPILRAHMSFLLGSFRVEKEAEKIKDKIFHEIIFSFLMVSRPRKKSVNTVWEMIVQNASGFTCSHPWLAGCTDVWKARTINDTTEEEETVEYMTKTISALADRIAENIIVSNHFLDQVSNLLEHLNDKNTYGRIFALLVAKGLITKLSGEEQLKAAAKIVGAMTVTNVVGVLYEDMLTDESLLNSILNKPSSETTLSIVQASILTLVPTLCKPLGSSINWLVESVSDTEDQSVRYVQLMRTVYTLSAGHSSVLVTPLFINLQDDCLLFLIGVCLTNSDDDIIRIALQHVSAFLEAHLSDTDDKATDFQTVVPALLVVLQKFKGERRYVLDCIDQLSRLTDKPFKSVYKFDEMYGAGSDQVQYLDRDDYVAYIVALAQHRPHFENDAGYLETFHQLHLAKRAGDKKKHAGFKEHALCWLLSHVVTITPLLCKVSLLKSLRLVSHKAKAETLYPLLLERLSINEALVQDDEYTGLLLDTLDASSASNINDGGALYTAFKNALDYCLRPGSMVRARETLVQNLRNGLFAVLTRQVQLELSKTLINYGSRYATASSYCKNGLTSLVTEVPLIVTLLGALQPAIDDVANRAPKRTKVTDSTDDSLSELSLFAEVLASTDLPGSIELISRTMDALHHVVQFSSSTTMDVNYIEQLLMTALSKIVEKIDELPNLSPSVVKLEVLVEVIRVTDNPQTSHQALLLIANLARLSAEAVLHNVMPVFTFMGSNVFHRDDTYSFQVVSKTIDSVVPVMVSFLKKEAYGDEQELFIRSREFLRTFTDAANHIPRHRRTKFFTHLVDVLGPDDFLAPVLMLLVERSVNRVIRQAPDEAIGTLSLPISILQHCTTSVRLKAATQLLNECKRLTDCVCNDAVVHKLFLEAPFEVDDINGLQTALSRQAQALLTFIGYSYKTDPEKGPSDTAHKPSTIVAGTFSLIAPELEAKAKDVHQAARASVYHLIERMHARDFVDTVEMILRLDKNQTSQIEAFNLLHNRLPLVSESIRKDLSSIVTKIIQVSLEIVAQAADPQVSAAAFRAFGAIGQTTSGGEEGSLMSIVPSALSAIKARSIVTAALTALQPLPSKLGPRMIPFVREIINECVGIIREGPEVATTEGIKVLQGLLTSIPSFWGSEEIQKVSMFCIEQSDSRSALPLVKNIAKRLPSKNLLPSLCQMWPKVTSSNLQRTENYFDLLGRALRFSTKSDASDNLRSLFGVIQNGLEILTQFVDSLVESSAVLNAFTELTSKLNDGLFKPLFRRLHDWAFASGQRAVEKQIVFCKLYHALQVHFKMLVNPYMSLLLAPLIDILDNFSHLNLDSVPLWTLAVTVLNTSFDTDDGAFWREDQLRQVASPLLRQAPVCNTSSFAPEAKEILSKCIVNMAELMTNDAALKALNLELLMHTRSEDSHLRVFALTCAENLWLVHGGKFLGFAPETATFIAECAEDENDLVVKQAKRLKIAVESVAGSISGL